MSSISDHPLRYHMVNELHARPFPPLTAPATAVFLAVKRRENAAARDRQADRDHLIALLDRFGAQHPQPGATHFFGALGQHMLKWESHTEVVTYTVFLSRLSARAFDPADFEVFPDDWLQNLPGERISSALIRVEPMPEPPNIAPLLADWFVPESLTVSYVLEEAAVIAGDFRIDPAGHTRFAVFAAPGTGRRRIGRIVQRLCEIEMYKTLSMLGFTRTRQIAAPMSQIDEKLIALMQGLSNHGAPGEDVLDKLLELSTQIERLSTKNAFRFGATAAYEALVNERIAALREARFEGRQTFAEFMMRRYDPAMRTVKSAERRLQDLSTRAMRAGELLRTKVDVARSAQNQALLESMDRRADLQLRLQETVEGLSVVAISYYAVSLVGYIAYPLAQPLGLSKGMLTALITLPVVALVWGSIRRLRAKIH